MTMIEVDLPEATAKAARDAGLLTPAALDRVLIDAIRRRQAADSLLSLADLVAAAGIEEMPMDEINAEVKAARGTAVARSPVSRTRVRAEIAKKPCRIR